MSETCSVCLKPLPTGWVAERGITRYATATGPVAVCSAECDDVYCSAPRSMMPEPQEAPTP